MERGGRLSYLVLRHRWRTSSSYARRIPTGNNSLCGLFLLRDKLQFQAQFLSTGPGHLFSPEFCGSCPLLVRLNVEFSPVLPGAQLNYRMIHSTGGVLADAKPSSKIEETVNRLKKKQLEKLVDKFPRAASVIAKEEAATEAAEPKEASSKALDKPKKSLWIRFVDEVKHYYSGFKLLFLDVRICTKIVWKVLQGNDLTRRENKQLVRTVSDLFRLVPFSVFIIVPFMEFLLPIALKLFPGMLPSTFTTMSEREQKMKRTLKAKLEYAKFLQKTLDDMGPSSSEDRNSQSASDFVAFYKVVKEKGTQMVHNKDILKFSKLFKDEITLDNMERRQLVALCRLLELTPMGNNNFLIFQLEMKLRQLQTDDKVIQREGVENMDVGELQSACKERGMRALGLSEKQLQRQLSQWLDLSLNHNVPPSLLLLSRTLYLPENISPTAQIAATISSLPQSAATHTSADIGEQEGKIRNVTRLEVLKEEQRKIEEEAKEAELQKAAEKLEDIKAEVTKKAATLVAEVQEEKPAEKHIRQTKGLAVKATVSKEGELQEELVDKAPVMRDGGVEVEMVQESNKGLAKKLKEEISSKDLSDLKSAILSLGKAETNETEILGLRKELKDYAEDLEELKFIKAEAGRFDLQESTGAKRLFSKVNRMLSRVDSLVSSLEEQEKAIKAKIEEDRPKQEREQEEENLVSVHELIAAVQKLQKTSDSSKVEQIANVLGRMDEDADGIIKVDAVMKVIELLGRQSVKLSGKEIDQIVDMLAKEEMLAVEANIEEVLGKSLPDKEHKDDGGSKSSTGDGEAALRTMSRKDGDIAKDLTEQESEPHIREMFADKEEEKKLTKVKKASDHDNGPMNLK